MTSRDIMKTAIFLVGVIERNPASEMIHGTGPRPVGIVLVPSNHSAVMRRFTEKLVVPESNCPTSCRVPVVFRGRCSPLLSKGLLCCLCSPLLWKGGDVSQIVVDSE